MITLKQELVCSRKYRNGRGKLARPVCVSIAVVFGFNKWTGDCKIYAAVQSLTIKQGLIENIRKIHYTRTQLM
jgi:hypothetical protein